MYNSTTSLITALEVLDSPGKVIRALLFCGVASTHSLLWNGIKPIFIDIDTVTLNFDLTQIDNAFTPLNIAIMDIPEI